MNDGPLDMRMDSSSDITAEKVVNEYDEKSLTKIFREYGEERHANKIANEIVKVRENKRITTTKELVNIIDRCYPYKEKRNTHPAKKVFQALRIEVNGELENLEQAVRDAFDVLNEKGRLVIISFHSLEDRIVKKVFTDLSTGCVCKEYSPICICGRKERGKLITKKPLTASEEELEKNSRSASAKVRIIEKI